MTVEKAIEKVRRVGSVELIGGAIRYEIRHRGPEVTEALATLRAHKPEALAYLSAKIPTPQMDPMGSALKGSAIELWSTASGSLFLVADDADAHKARERLGARRARFTPLRKLGGLSR
jgi:hypothetical protein